MWNPFSSRKPGNEDFDAKALCAQTGVTWNEFEEAHDLADYLAEHYHGQVLTRKDATAPNQHESIVQDEVDFVPAVPADIGSYSRQLGGNKVAGLRYALRVEKTVRQTAYYTAVFSYVMIGKPELKPDKIQPSNIYEKIRLIDYSGAKQAIGRTYDDDGRLLAACDMRQDDSASSWRKAVEVIFTYDKEANTAMIKGARAAAEDPTKKPIAKLVTMWNPQGEVVESQEITRPELGWVRVARKAADPMREGVTEEKVERYMPEYLPYRDRVLYGVDTAEHLFRASRPKPKTEDWPEEERYDEFLISSWRGVDTIRNVV